MAIRSRLSERLPVALTPPRPLQSHAPPRAPRRSAQGRLGPIPAPAPKGVGEGAPDHQTEQGRGHQPLPWWSLGTYSGDFRHCLLRLKRTGSGRILTALLSGLQPLLPSRSTGWLVPIPSWKRRHANPLPAQIAAGLGRVNPNLLRRTRAGVGQHRLSRQQRLVNLQGAFHSPASAEALDLWLVDDILTTGATALAAREALTTAGHRVHGLICLARTPAQANGR